MLISSLASYLLLKENSSNFESKTRDFNKNEKNDEKMIWDEEEAKGSYL